MAYKNHIFSLLIIFTIIIEFIETQSMKTCHDHFGRQIPCDSDDINLLKVDMDNLNEQFAKTFQNLYACIKKESNKADSAANQATQDGNRQFDFKEAEEGFKNFTKILLNEIERQQLESEKSSKGSGHSIIINNSPKSFMATVFSVILVKILSLNYNGI